MSLKAPDGRGKFSCEEGVWGAALWRSGDWW